MNYDESEDYADKVMKYENIIKKLKKERDTWKRDAIQSKAQLGEHRIALQQEKCKRCKLEDTDRCKEC